MAHYQRKQLLRIIGRRYTHNWNQPIGYDTGIKVFHCISGTQVPLIVKNPQLVSWYTCGPTVYDAAHIGHASCYMRLDIIQNILKHHFRLNIVSTMNITDIDDKIIAQSRVEKISTQEMSREYEKLFWADLVALNITQPQKVVRVTEEMPQIIAFISSLMNQQFAYKAVDGSIYFDVKAYEDAKDTWRYGKLQKISREATGKSKIKKNMEDFALWKAAKPNEPSWEAPFGPGRPGWHIECSAMASMLFGSNIDIHAGGVDLQFPHHENEEAQSCAYHGCVQWVNYWLHTGHLHLSNDVKMSKSLKNTVSIQELLKTCSADVFRMACLLTNYKSHMEFSPEHIKLAEGNLKNLQNFLNNVPLTLAHSNNLAINTESLLPELETIANNIDECLRKDFDTAGCIKQLNSLISSCNKVIHAAATNSNASGENNSVVTLLAIANYVQNICQTFGLKFQEKEQVTDNSFNEIMDVLVNFRHQLRTLSVVRKDREALAICDDLRNECKKLGITLKDHSKISTWSK